MNDIQVNLRKPSESGRLYYRPDPQIYPFVFYIESQRKGKRRAYSINIDSAIIIDLDHEYLVQSVEFNIHKKVWQSTSSLIIPEESVPADIQVANLIEKDALIERSVVSKTNDEQSIAFFYWIELRSDGKWIGLSDQCFAYIVGQYLGGFLVRLF